MNFTFVYCDTEKGGCGGVVEDYLEGYPPSRLHRCICPKCHMRVWIQRGQMTRIDRKPARLPKAVA